MGRGNCRVLIDWCYGDNQAGALWPLQMFKADCLRYFLSCSATFLSHSLCSPGCPTTAECHFEQDEAITLTVFPSWTIENTICPGKLWELSPLPMPQPSRLDLSKMNHSVVLCVAHTIETHTKLSRWFHQNPVLWFALRSRFPSLLSFLHGERVKFFEFIVLSREIIFKTHPDL